MGRKLKAKVDVKNPTFAQRVATSLEHTSFFLLMDLSWSRAVEEDEPLLMKIHTIAEAVAQSYFPSSNGDEWARHRPSALPGKFIHRS